MSPLAAFLRSAREKANLTQGDVASQLGYTTPQYISNWERDMAPFPLDQIMPFVRITKCSKAKFKKLILSELQEEIEGYFE